MEWLSCLATQTLANERLGACRCEHGAHPDFFQKLISKFVSGFGER